MLNIALVVGKQLNMTTLNKAIFISGLNTVLEGREVYTVFAPSDMAFDKLETNTLEELLSPYNQTRLTELLKNHIIKGRLNFDDLKNGDKLETLNGTELLVTQNLGKTSINHSVIQNRDIQTLNGNIHSLDKVL